MKDELAIPDGWSANDVRRWLLQLFGRSGYSELPGLSSQMDAPVRIQALFDRSSTPIQEILKEGAVSALREWRLQAHGFRALDQLSRTTALLKATAAVPVLAGIATRQMYFEEEAERLRSLSVIVACLCGFAPGVDVEAALRRLFYEPRLKPILAGQLFVGLCRCRPESYPSYVNRFLELRDKTPGRFPHIGRPLLDAIPPITVIDKFEELDGPSRTAFADILCNTPESQFDWDYSERGVGIYWQGLPRKKVLITPVTRKEHFELLATQFDKTKRGFVGNDINEILFDMLSVPKAAAARPN